jgi:alpha-tubulin suppressor-like RCC1 family protein
VKQWTLNPSSTAPRVFCSAALVVGGLAAVALLDLTLTSNAFAQTITKGPIAPRQKDTMLRLPGSEVLTRSPPPPPTWIEISAGIDHTCARKTNGDIFCWGRNTLRQLGIDATARPSNGVVLCPNGDCLPKPQLVLGGGVQVEAGGNHTCAINTAQQAICWGDNSSFQVAAIVNGAGLSVNPIPALVAGNLKFTQISAGQRGTCGVTTTGTFCWGNIINGANVAIGTVPPTQAPPTLHLKNTDFSTVTVGDRQVCSRHSLNGASEIVCWGADDVSQCGFDRATLPTPLNVNLVPPAFSSSLGHNVGEASAGHDFTCVNRGDGTVACVGNNRHGQLGLGTADRSLHPVAQAVGGGMALHGVSAGVAHACALDSKGLAFCWGRGIKGQLGQGAFTDSATPVAVGGGRSYSAIAAGGNHTCAIGTDNVLYCWGLNTFGQMGIGAGESSAGYTTPQVVAQPAQ